MHSFTLGIIQFRVWIVAVATLTLALFAFRYAWQHRRSPLKFSIYAFAFGLLILVLSLLSLLVQVGSIDQQFLHDALFLLGIGSIAYGVGRLPEPIQ